jgi:hypothetical protein
LLVAFSTGDAVPPKVEQLTADELQSKAGLKFFFYIFYGLYFNLSFCEGRLKAFKRSVSLTVWEIKAKLDAMEV